MQVELFFRLTQFLFIFLCIPRYVTFVSISLIWIMHEIVKKCTHEYMCRHYLILITDFVGMH